MGRDFLLFFWDMRGGIFVLLVMGVVAIIGLRYMAWLFRWGRFKPCASSPQGTPAAAPRTEGQLAYVMADFFVKLVNDFRHLLALILVAIFALVLVLAIWRSPGTVDDIGKALVSVTSALGGLIGSIIGYYFGESAVKKADPPPPATPAAAPAVQALPPAQSAAATGGQSGPAGADDPPSGDASPTPQPPERL